MDPIDDLRQRMTSASGSDAQTTTRPEPPGRHVIEPTSMSRVVWRIPPGDESGLRAASERPPRTI
jgi:hypothetical protein